MGSCVSYNSRLQQCQAGYRAASYLDASGHNVEAVTSLIMAVCEHGQGSLCEADLPLQGLSDRSMRHALTHKVSLSS
jgi:hypothetical protein